METNTECAECLSAEDIAAFATGEADDRARAATEAHLAECGACATKLALFVRMLSDDDDEAEVLELDRATRAGAVDLVREHRAAWPVVVPMPARSRRLLARLAAAALVCVVGSAGYWAWKEWRERSTLARTERAIAAATAVERPSALRFAGAPYAPYVATRGAHPDRGRTALALARATVAERATPEALRALGQAALIAGRPDEAVEALARARTATPGNASIEVDYAVALAESGDLAGAEATLSAAVDRDPTDAAAVFDLAVVRQRLGKTDEATRDWERYLALDGASPWADEARRSLGR